MQGMPPPRMQSGVHDSGQFIKPLLAPSKLLQPKDFSWRNWMVCIHSTFVNEDCGYR